MPFVIILTTIVQTFCNVVDFTISRPYVKSKLIKERKRYGNRVNNHDFFKVGKNTSIKKNPINDIIISKITHIVIERIVSF